MDERIEKIRAAVLDMMKLVTIDEHHMYTRTSDGKWLAGVSTISDVMPKPWLAAWGSKEAVKFLGFSDYKDDTKVAEETLKKLRFMSLKDYLKLLEEAKGAARRKSGDAKLDGTAGHAWIEKYVLAKIHGDERPELPGGMLDRPLTQFIDWAEANVEAWVFCEARLVDVENEFAGTCDAGAILKTGRFALIDWKFASTIGEDYYLQLTGYSIPFEKYGIKVDDRVIVRLPKTETQSVWDPKTRTYSNQPNNIEVRYVETPYDFDKATFLAARQVAKWSNFMQNR